MTARLRVGWILRGDEEQGSSRIQGFNVHRYLTSVGVDSRVLVSPKKPCNNLRVNPFRKVSIAFGEYDVIVFQKVFGPKAVRFCRALKKLGKKTVLVLSDLQDNEMINVADRTIVTSNFLAARIRERYGVSPVVIDDAIEVPAGTRGSVASRPVPGAMPRAVWVGCGENWPGIERLMKLIDGSPLKGSFEIVTVSYHPDATVRWTKDAAVAACRTSDFALLPTGRTDWARCKSSNRLSLHLASGLPVVAEPIPSYIELAERTGGVLWAEDDEAWLEGIRRMLDPRFREEIRRGAEERVRVLLDMSVIGPQWHQALLSVAESGPGNPSAASRGIAS